MKPIRLLSFLLCLVLLLFACEGEESMTIVCSWNEIVQTGATFRVEGLYRQSAETLSSRARMTRLATVDLHTWLDAGQCLFLREGLDIPFVYDKISGTVSVVCQIDSCTHKDCIWARAGTHIYSGGDVLFFYVQKEKNLYVGDMHGENLRTLCETGGGELFYLVREGDFLYFEEALGKKPSDEDGDEPLFRLLRVNIDGNERAEVLADEIRSWVPFQFLPTENCFLYRLSEESAYVLYDRRAKREYKLPKTALPLAFYGEWLYYTDMVGDWEPDKPRTLCRLSLYDPLERESLFDIDAEYSTVLFSGDKLYLMETSIYSKSEAHGIYDQTKLYTADLQGNDKTLFMEFQTDGIPDRVDELWIDGNLLYMEYRTYHEFPNEYDPNGKPAGLNRKLIDLSTGRELLIKKE